MEQVTVTVGGQAGSEGKGAVTARLHREREYHYAVRVGGPNAGHTVMHVGKKYALRQLPVAAIADPGCNLVIAAGSEIDPQVLFDEIEMVEYATGVKVGSRLFIDREATLISDHHKETEVRAIATGTTGKGIGAARADRAMRSAKRVADVPAMGLHCIDTQDLLQDELQAGSSVMIEGTQGYVLGSHAGYYPYCTSGNCRAIDFLAAAGLPPLAAEVWVVLRTYPIRIAGNSGPLERETTWERIGVDPEITTVTKKVRRVGEWNWDWAQRSVQANRGPRRPQIALTFADYWWRSVAGLDGRVDRAEFTAATIAKLREIETRLRAPVRMLGTGPDTQLLIEHEEIY